LPLGIAHDRGVVRIDPGGDTVFIFRGVLRLRVDRRGEGIEQRSGAATRGLGIGKRMLKILGRKTSSNVQKVLWCCDEIGLAFERSDVGGTFGGNKTAEYLVLNPNGLVPTIDDDGFVLWESNPIVRYLAAKHAMGTLCPADLRKRADADRWMDWQQTVVAGAVGGVFPAVRRSAPDARGPPARGRPARAGGAAPLILR